MQILIKEFKGAPAEPRHPQGPYTGEAAEAYRKAQEELDASMTPEQKRELALLAKKLPQLPRK